MVSSRGKDNYEQLWQAIKRVKYTIYNNDTNMILILVEPRKDGLVLGAVAEWRTYR